MQLAGYLPVSRAHPGPDGSDIVSSTRRPAPPMNMWGGSWKLSRVKGTHPGAK